MESNYQTPQIEVLELAVEDAVLAGSGGTTTAATTSSVVGAFIQKVTNW